MQVHHELAMCADFSPLDESICVGQSIHDVLLPTIGRCSSFSASQGCEASDGKMCKPALELPPPHRFIRNPAQASKFGFKSVKTATPDTRSYIAAYRHDQGRAMASKACNQDEVFKLASEIARLLPKMR